MSSLDSWIAALLIPLGIVILLSGLDDLVLDAACFYDWLRSYRRKLDRPRGDCQFHAVPQKRIAILVPLWQEEDVIRQMIEHNIATNLYTNYDLFVGVYPNDKRTLEVVSALEERFPNVHLALCPHAGPTSKSDNLNWAYHRMTRYEGECSVRFEVVVTHDAEDIIHPSALHWINYYTETCEMVQLPVLALRSPLHHLTHGVYCDDFAEYQTKDMRARQILRSFIPSNGVGTGYRRTTLERLAAHREGQVFDPACLTEDYETGLRLFRMNCSQVFAPLARTGESFVATREYFPRTFQAAVKQRTRWVTGISLQSWEWNGWRGGFRLTYWFWRDRKGLLGNPFSLLANWILMYGAATWCWSWFGGTPWGLAGISQTWLTTLLFWTTLILQFWRTSVRVVCVARIFGCLFACGVPIRSLWANWINCFATLSALLQYFRARHSGEPLVWLKTEHTYPSMTTQQAPR